MFALYVAFLIFGAAFTIPMVLGGIGADAEVDGGLDADFDGDADVGGGFDTDIDADADADFDSGADVDAGGGSGWTGELGSIFASLFSFRSIVFGCTFFGLTGVVLHLLNVSAASTLVLSLILGFVAAALNATLWSQLRRVGDVSSTVHSRDLIGATGTVVLPVEPGRKGRVQIELEGQPQYLVATAFRDRDEPLNVGDPIVVVEVDSGTVKVAPFKELESG